MGYDEYREGLDAHFSEKEVRSFTSLFVSRLMMIAKPGEVES